MNKTKYLQDTIVRLVELGNNYRHDCKGRIETLEKEWNDGMIATKDFSDQVAHWNATILHIDKVLNDSSSSLECHHFTH